MVALVAGGSALAAGLATRWAVKRAAERAPAPSPPPAPRPPSALAQAGFELDLGDVVEVLGRELWLEEAWLLSEGTDSVAALYSAREATLLALPSPAATLYLLDPVELGLPEEPPSSLESRGVRFERVRRLPVAVKPVGKTAPLPWDEALLSEYRGLGHDALWVIGRGGRARVFQGRSVPAADVVRWGGGERTLE